MKNPLKLASFILLAVLVFLPVRSAAASGGVFDGQVIFGQSFTLESGDTLTGDLLVFGGTADVQAGAVVDGSVVLFGGKLTIDGEVTGDVSATGATVTLGPAAHIRGDLITVGVTLDRADTAQVDGQIFNTATSWSDASNGEQPVEPFIPSPEVIFPRINFNLDPLRGVWNAMSNALGLGVLAMLVALFLAPHAGRVSQAVVNQPVMAGGVGLLVAFLTPIALVMMAITVILIPVAGLAAVALIIAGVFGWIALGMEVGRRFTRAIHQTWHPSLEAGLGTFTLTLVAAALTGIPVLNCVGWLVPFLLGLAAFGAVVMTRFGTQSVAAPAAETPAPLAPVVPEAPLPPAPPEEPKHRKKTG
ncbi:MAG: polymer-forming cytoskeletal protein [Chloroflexota bacterium]